MDRLDSVLCSLRGSNTPQANYEFAAFTRLLKEQVGILGVEPRLTRYKQAALTIKLYSLGRTAEN